MLFVYCYANTSKEVVLKIKINIMIKVKVLLDSLLSKIIC